MPLQSKGLSRVFSNNTVQKHQFFFIAQLSHPYMTTGKAIALTRWAFVDKVMSLLFNMLSRLVITFLPQSKRLLISWQQSPSAGEGNGNPLQYSCLENPTDGGAWWAAVHGVPRSRSRLSDFTFTFHFHALEKEMATHSSVLAWRIPGMVSLVGCHLWGHTESDTTEAT